MSSLAAAYGMKKAKKHGGADCSMCGGGECRLAKGGKVQEDDIHKGVHEARGGGGHGSSFSGSLIRSETSVPKETRMGWAKEEHKKKLHELQSMKKPNLYAKGGVTVSRKPATPDPTDESINLFSTPKTMGPDIWRPAGGYGHDWARSGNGQSYSMDDYSDPKKQQYVAGYADGGLIDGDVVDDVMQERKANATPPIADEMPAEFDDLVLDDNLEAHDSSNEIGDEQEDEDRMDVVQQVMRSRAKKDRNPRTA